MCWVDNDDIPLDNSGLELESSYLVNLFCLDFVVRLCVEVTAVIHRSPAKTSLNSSPPSAPHLRQWTGSTLVQIMACRLSAPSHYLDQCWNIFNWTLRNKLKWNLNQNTKLSIHEITFVSPAPPALVIFCYKCTCSTVMGPINLFRFLAPFCQFFAIHMVHSRRYDYLIVLKMMTQSCHADCVVVNCWYW